MKVLELLRKEARWGRHNAVPLLFLLVVLPLAFAGTSVAFATVLPEDVPVAIVAADEDTTEDDVAIVKGSITLFSDVREYDSVERADRALRRETVYAVVEVPPGIANRSRAPVNITMTVGGNVVPFHQPSQIVAGAMEVGVDGSVPADVGVNREFRGEEKSLPEYLVPVFLFALVALFAMTYLPYNLAGERRVVERVRVEASLEALVAAKVVYFAALMLVPILAFAAMARYLGQGVALLAPGAVGILLLTFVYLAAISTGVMLLTKLSTFGRFVNVVIMLGLMVFSNLIYPVGFFSTLRRTVARRMPLYHSMVIVRSETLTDAPLSLFADRIALLAGFTLVTLLFLKGAIVHYERTI